MKNPEAVFDILSLDPPETDAMGRHLTHGYIVKPSGGSERIPAPLRKHGPYPLLPGAIVNNCDGMTGIDTPPTEEELADPRNGIRKINFSITEGFVTLYSRMTDDELIDLTTRIKYAAAGKS